MNDTIRIFLAVLQAALQGKRPQLPQAVTPRQWQTLFHLAGIHHVLPLFYEAVYDQSIPEEAALQTTRQQVRHQVIAQAVRTGEFLELNDRLLQAGVRPLVVKGIVCRSLYPQPDHRPSGDEDVLIPPEQFDLCHQILTEFGMTAQEQTESYEVPYRKAEGPLYIELHKSLFPPESDAYGDLNRFFEAVHQRAVPLQVQGHTVYTLAPTDHLFYLICHAFKHFLHSGFGIRQVCDICLFANAYGSQVDWLRVLEDCRAIHAEKFAAAIFAIGQKHLVFDPAQACCPAQWQIDAVDEMPMLNDLLAGGLYGDSSLIRKQSSNITLDAVAAQKAGRQAKGGIAASVFLPASKLEGRYPYLKKYPYLLPAAWCNRLWTYSKKAGSGAASSSLKIGAERVELMKLYGILD